MQFNILKRFLPLHKLLMLHITLLFYCFRYLTYAYFYMACYTSFFWRPALELAHCYTTLISSLYASAQKDNRIKKLFNHRVINRLLVITILLNRLFEVNLTTLFLLLKRQDRHMGTLGTCGYSNLILVCSVDCQRFI